MGKWSLVIAYQCAYNTTLAINVIAEDTKALQQAATCWRYRLEGSLGILPYPFQYHSTRLEQIIFDGILNQAHTSSLFSTYRPQRYIFTHSKSSLVFKS